jgi:hypothetical protein
MMLPITGTPGTVAGVTEAAAEGAPAPTELLALTLHE